MLSVRKNGNTYFLALRALALATAIVIMVSSLCGCFLRQDDNSVPTSKPATTAQQGDGQTETVAETPDQSQTETPAPETTPTPENTQDAAETPTEASTGEPIIGALIPKHGIEIHREGCPHLQSIPESRRIAMEWNRDSKKEFSVHLKIETDDRKGITTDIMDATAKAKVFIERMSVVSGKKNGRVRLVFRIARRDMLEHLMEEIREAIDSDNWDSWKKKTLDDLNEEKQNHKVMNQPKFYQKVINEELK